VETVAVSNMLMCVPQRLAHGLAASDLIETAPLPFESPSFDVSQFWHERNHVDDGHRWLRSLVYRHYSGMEQPA
jgi:DNA-binding transcriptional LysR family regulator